MGIVTQHPENEPRCPQSGINGGPIHPAHAMEVAIADRVYAVTPKDIDLDTTGGQILDRMSAAASAQPGMKLYEIMASPVNPRIKYYQSAYFHCLVCGFILPVQVMSR